MAQGSGAGAETFPCAGKVARGAGAGASAQAERTKKTAMAAKLNIATP
jgi:hypothetical protein